MARIEPIELNKAEGRAKAIMENAQKALGVVPNLMRTLAHSPAALEAYMAFNRALGAGRLSPQLREQIAVAVSAANECTYCTSAHTLLGRKFGADEAELKANLQGASSDPKTEAALQFARLIIANRGWVRDEDLDRVRAAGYGEAEIVEIVAAVAITTFPNYFDHIAQTQVDFPSVSIGEAASECGCDPPKPCAAGEPAAA